MQPDSAYCAVHNTGNGRTNLCQQNPVPQSRGMPHSTLDKFLTATQMLHTHHAQHACLDVRRRLQMADVCVCVYRKARRFPKARTIFHTAVCAVRRMSRVCCVCGHYENGNGSSSRVPDRPSVSGINKFSSPHTVPSLIGILRLFSEQAPVQSFPN